MAIKFIVEADCFVSAQRFRGFSSLSEARNYYVETLRKRKDFSRCWIYSIRKDGTFRERAFYDSSS
jgi:hypothetical protein